MHVERGSIRNPAPRTVIVLAQRRLLRGLLCASSLIALAAGACGGDTVVVVVGNPPIRVIHSVAVTPPDTALHVGEIAQLVAVVDADSGLSRSLRWRSSDATKAVLDSTGRVTALALGAVTITAMSIADTLVKGTAAVLVVNRPVVDVYTIGDSFSPHS